MKLHKSKAIEKKEPEYILYNDLYEGDKKVMASEKYLPYHELESDQSVEGAKKIRKTRENLSRYTNFPRRAFRRYKSIIFQKPIQFSPDALEFLESNNLLNNIDGKGTGVENFIKNVLFKQKFIFGDSYLLSVAEDESAIWDVPNTMNVKDLIVSKGNLSLFRYEYEVSVPRKSSQEEDKTFVYSDEYFIDNNKVFLNRYKAEKKDNQFEKEIDWEVDLIAEEVSNFKNIPVAFSLGDSFVKDASNDCLEYHNIKSSLLNQLYHQAFQKIIITGNVDTNQKFAFSEFSVNIIRTTDESSASVNVVPPTDTTALRNQLAESSQNVLKSFYHYNRTISADSGVGESAESQELAKEDLLNVIKTEIEDLEKQVNEGLQNLAIQLGVKNFTGEIIFNKDISIQNLDQILREEMAYLNIIQTKYPTWFKKLMVKVATRQNLDDEDVINEINEVDAIIPNPAPTGLDITNL